MDITTGQAPTIDPAALLADMSMTLITINIIAGLIGMYYFGHGKKTLNIPMIISGILLCVIPYFISNIAILIVICLAITATPFAMEKYI